MQEELAQMLAIEKSYHYLSTGSENEYLYVLKILNENTDLAKCTDDKLKLLSLKKDEFFIGNSRFASQINTIKNSVHAYWLQLVNRFVP